MDGFIEEFENSIEWIKVAMLENGTFMVRFRSLDGKKRVMEAGTFLYDKRT